MMLLAGQGAVAGQESRAQLALVALGQPALGRAFGLAQQMRQAGLRVWMDLSGKKGMKQQMKAAAASGASHTLILGEDELARGVAALKHMGTQEQRELSLDGLAAKIMEAYT
jgi:histidyl-tRNA synthetase